MTETKDKETAIRGLVETFVAGWNRGDGTLLASVFAENADFTAITGLHGRGADLIARGHDEILSTIYRGTRNSATVDEIHFLRPDVALANVRFFLTRDGRSFFPGVSYSSAGIIATEENGKWSIAVFRNMIPFARPSDQSMQPESTEEPGSVVPTLSN